MIYEEEAIPLSIDIPWISPVFNHGILVFYYIFNLFSSLLGMFSGSGAFCEKVMFLEHFGVQEMIHPS